MPTLPPGDYTDEFTSTGAGTFVVPDNCFEVTAHCIGGGGGSSGTSAGFGPSFERGGAGGSYARRTFAVTPGESISYNVGPGGPGGGGSGAGTSGTASWFKANDSTGCVAVGGQRSDTNTAGVGTTTGCFGDVVYKGGDGGTVSGSFSGGGGGGAGTTGAGGNGSASGTGGGSGTSLYGGRGGHGMGGANGANPGLTYGGGAGGAAASAFTTSGGAAGAQGIVVVQYTVAVTEKIDSDTASAGNEIASIAFAAGPDTVAATEGTPSITATWPTPLADSAPAPTESQSVSIDTSDAVGQVAESAQISTSDFDTATVAETAEVIPATEKADSDTLAVTETQLQSAPPIEVTESFAALTETEALTVAADDAVELVDAGGTELDKDGSDTGSVVELAAVIISDSDSLGAADGQSTAETKLGTDSLAIVDQAVLTSVVVSTSDGLGLLDSELVSGDGIEILHPRKHIVERAVRKHTVQPGYRAHYVEGYRRVHTVEPDYRTHYVERERRVYVPAKES